MNQPSKCYLSLIGLVLLAPSGTNAAGTNTFVYEVVGGWTIFTDTARDFTCSMEARYEGGSVVRVGFDAGSGGSYMIVAEPAWSGIQVGNGYSVAVTFGDHGPWRLRAAGVALDGDAGVPAGLRLAIDQREADAFMNQFMKGYSVEVGYGDNEPLTLSLHGTHRAALKLDECQDAMAAARTDD